MRALVLVVLAACELQPPPPAPPPAPPAQAGRPSPIVVADAAEVAVVAAVDAGAPPPDAMPVTAACVVTGAHIADILIASASDPSLKASYEQARDRIVRTTAEACTSQLWTADAQRCFALSKLKADLEACEKKFPRPEASVPHPAKR
jgi:hypothetical protein